MDATFDLPDSTDWLSTSLPAFESVEAALRCEVCKEFYANPVITSCSHTFCSICIRRCIATDGKCPSCKGACSSDKLSPNIAVREVVGRFQDVRGSALELARRDKERAQDQANGRKGKKRKLEDTDIEEDEMEGCGKQTRNRRTRRGNASLEVPDSEEDGDEDFVPDGMAKCPICSEAMKPEQVYNHLDVCPGQNASQGRSTRSRTKTAFPNPLQRRQKEPSPPPSRLSQLNYAMLKEGALRKKLQEIGIPNWGSKDLLKRRHIEWLNIYNSNCDADEGVRKGKRQLLKELEEWEHTQGGRADSKESKIMRKDFDGSGYAKANKSDFDDLIARARQKRLVPKAETEHQENGAAQQEPEGLRRNGDMDVDHGTGSLPQPSTIHDPHSPQKSLEIDESALGDLQREDPRTNQMTLDSLHLGQEAPRSGNQERAVHSSVVTHALTSPTKKKPIFSQPEEPVREIEKPTVVQ
ncbi:DNA repair protein rad18 [Dothidotthia symphoricarpi CBS 119687]|uniref:Postreplication repair E3 ubiquitin-protein ligase RAD18 n=1 Tax=Dothidotthia symphoricarpi CBS 119687 TaxID=1392245 RepID=A0A6A6AEG3_9PLEO|nr:DNA repair protein rad18 [Dothidotthia symphoricarpi CBS 119687]KAF2129495.1 DNA repair protein rad18 [Dothidotthia symphoricarpi CBS 119687]